MRTASLSIRDFAAMIEGACKRLDEARDADTALDALNELQTLAEDHKSLRLLASSYQLLEGIYLEEMDAPGSASPDSIGEIDPS